MEQSLEIFCAKSLLSHKDIDVSEQNEFGDASLYISSSNEHGECVQELLAPKDVNIYAINSEVKTAFPLTTKEAIGAFFDSKLY